MRHSSKGFTLIEALIAIVIFGVGLLAVASLQIVARKATYEAVQRTAAAQLAESMLERMRANAIALEVYVGGTGELILGGGTRGVPASTCQVRAAPCTPAGMALADLWEWERQLDGAYEVADGQAVGGLVSPTACVRGQLDGGTGPYAVAIAWRGTSESDEPPPDACGAGNPAYAGDDGTADARRKVVVVQTFINAL